MSTAIRRPSGLTFGLWYSASLASSERAAPSRLTATSSAVLRGRYKTEPVRDVETRAIAVGIDDNGPARATASPDTSKVVGANGIPWRVLSSVT